MRRPFECTAAIAALTLLLASASEAGAQIDATDIVGEDVRVSWLLNSSSWSRAQYPVQRRTDGELLGVRDGQLLVDRGAGSIAIPLGSIRSVRQRVGTKPATAPEMVIGSGAGFALGFLAGVLRAQARTDQGPGQQGAVDHGLAIGVLLGAPIGALTAYVRSRSRGIYEDVDISGLRPEVYVAPSGAVGLGLELDAR